MNIVVLDYSTIDVPLDDIKALGEVSFYDTTSKEETLKRAEKAEVIITNKVLLDRDTLQRCKNLKLICVAATGVNNIDLEAAKDLGIAVTNVARYSTDSVVEHTFALYFHAAREMEYYTDYGKKEWTGSPIFTNVSKPYHELSGKKWGIIGLGSIGKKVATVAQAFGCQVSYYSTSRKNTSDKFQQENLKTLLKTCDIVSIHSPLNSDTKDLIRYDDLIKIKKGATLINLGRGGIVNEDDLNRALEERSDLTFGTDVMAQEPPEKSGLFERENFIVTPHVAWASVEARERLALEIYKNIDSFLKTKERNRVA